MQGKGRMNEEQPEIWLFEGDYALTTSYSKSEQLYK